MPGLEKPGPSAPWPRLSPALRIPSPQDLHKFIRPILVILPALGLLLGFAARIAGNGQWSGTIWAAATLPVLGALLIEIVASLRRGDIGLDVVAALSMTGALVFGEHLAAVVVALMYAGGQYLENFAERRANREMTALLARLPRTAIRYRDGRLEEVSLDVVEPEDRLLVRQGDVVPVDGLVAEGMAVLDQSALTGESVPVQKKAGEPVMSGVTNVGDAFDVSATHRAAESTYAGIVRLIEAAQASKAPMARLADRFAMAFLALTVVLAGGAWLWSGDPIRALAVLVVATPCPLILAVPVAIVSGVSRAAKAGVLVKGGRALEALARVRVLVIDKTGTLTHGQARVVEIRLVAGLSSDKLLQLAASLDQASKHVIARALVLEAQASGLDLLLPTEVEEVPGEGLEGIVDGQHIVVGGTRFVAQRVPSACESCGQRSISRGIGCGSRGRQRSARRAPDPGGQVAVGSGSGDRQPSSVGDCPDRPGLGRPPRRGGSGHGRIAPRRGPCRPHAGPEDRHRAGREGLRARHDDRRRRQRCPGPCGRRPWSRHGCQGSCGIRRSGRRGSSGRSVGQNPRCGSGRALVQAHRAPKRLCRDRPFGCGMIVAALGYLTPVQGALIQEAIDVAVILNALRALRGPNEL